MEIQTSKPTVEGRYVVYIQCASYQVCDWCEPIIATWAGNRWHTHHGVFGWIGPLPVAHSGPLLDKIQAQQLEYDL